MTTPRMMLFLSLRFSYTDFFITLHKLKQTIMKKILMIVTLLAFLGCSKDNESGFLDVNAKIAINGVLTRSINIDTVTQIVENFAAIGWRNGEGYSVGMSSGRGDRYDEHNSIRRDIENKRILFGGGHVIQTDGIDPTWSQLGMFITDAVDIVFVAFKDKESGDFINLKILDDETNADAMFKVDTIAYIPNKILKKAQEDIKAAYAIEDFTTCYKLFDESFVFVPITGAKWRAMKAAGIE